MGLPVYLNEVIEIMTLDTLTYLILGLKVSSDIDEVVGARNCARLKRNDGNSAKGKLK